jgi:hypothetical protein
VLDPDQSARSPRHPHWPGGRVGHPHQSRQDEANSDARRAAQAGRVAIGTGRTYQCSRRTRPRSRRPTICQVLVIPTFSVWFDGTPLKLSHDEAGERARTRKLADRLAKQLGS